MTNKPEPPKPPVPKPPAPKPTPPRTGTRKSISESSTIPRPKPGPKE